MLSDVVIDLGEIFVRVLDVGPAVEVELIVGTVRNRDVVENVSSDGTHGNLIVGVVRAGSWIHQLRGSSPARARSGDIEGATKIGAEIAEISGAFCRTGNGDNLPVI